MFFKKLVVASHNPGKTREYEDFFAPWGIDLQSAADFSLSDTEETGQTFQENAFLKAKAVGDATGILSLGDDGGLVIPSLQGHPGIHSHRWAQSVGGFEKSFGVLETMLGTTLSRKAFFHVSLALYHPETKESHFFEGRCWGTLTFPPRGTYGFGYDRIFRPQGYDQTFGELGLDVKRKISHRAQALKELSNFSNLYSLDPCPNYRDQLS